MCDSLDARSTPPTTHAFVCNSWKVPQSCSYPILPIFLCDVSPIEFPSISSSKRSVRRGLIKVNGIVVKDITTPVKFNDVISRIVKVSELKAPIVPGACTLDVLFEDEYFAVVVKPQGMSVFTHKGNANGNGHNVKSALVNSVRTIFHSSVVRNYEQDDNEDATFRAINAISKKPLRRPQPVHRLDKETGGLLIVAKTHPALQAMTRAFSLHSVEKLYLAIVVGRLDGSGTINIPLDGKAAVTNYTSLSVTPSKKFGEITTLSLSIETGRTHQIRRHLEALGHPIIGDKRYGGLEMKEYYSEQSEHEQEMSMFLWSVSIRVEHPFVANEEIFCKIEEPGMYDIFRRSEAGLL